MKFHKMLGSMIRLILLASACFAFHSHAADANIIQAMTVTSGANGKVILKFSMAQPLQVLPGAFTVNSPARIAFDFPNMQNGLGKSSQDVAEGDLHHINVIQAGQRTRVVLNLNQMVGYETEIQGNDLLISLQGRANKTEVELAKPAHFAEAKAGIQNNSVRDIEFHRGPNGEGRIQIDLSAADIGVDIKRQGKVLHVDLQQTNLPSNLQRKLDVTDFATPVQMIDAFTQGSAAHLSIEPNGNWEYSAYQTDGKLVIDIRAVLEDPNKLVKSGQVGYAGDRLTLNFQNIDTREALNVIADFTGLNMVISDSVSGSLTLRLKEVPWDQALDIILDSKGLDRRKNGNVIQVAPREEIAAKEKSNLSARQEITELEVMRTESFLLSYAKAVDLEKLLSNEKQRILSKRGSVIADVRTNMIFVQDGASYLEDVRRLVKQIDIPVRQVMIEARFIEAGDTFSRTLGGKLNASGPINKPAGSTSATVQGSTGGVGNVSLPVTNAGNGGLLVSLFGAGDTQTLSMEINASDVDGKTKNIASPRVVTGDKSEASIESGVEIPYQQGGTASVAATVAFKKAVLSLKVTPQITPDNRVNMKVAVSQDVVGTVYSGVPSINTKQVSTQVLVDNGGTVVIGGIYTQDDSGTKTQVPLFGDIPILGWLFKSDVTIKNKKELLIFITPRILKDNMNIN